MSSGSVLEKMNPHKIHLVQVEALLISRHCKLSLVTEQQAMGNRDRPYAGGIVIV